MNLTLILFFIVFAIEAFLSHQPGEESGAESRALAKTLHVSESFLRTAAHVVFFAILSFLAVLSANASEDHIAAAAVGVWALADEWTKSFPCFPGRHFSWKDVGWNFVGLGIGAIAAILVLR